MSPLSLENQVEMVKVQLQMARQHKKEDLEKMQNELNEQVKDPSNYDVPPTSEASKNYDSDC